MTELETKLQQRYGVPKPSAEKEESLAEVIARLRKNATPSAPKSAEIDWTDITVVKPLFIKSYEQLCNFRNRPMKLTEDFSEAVDKVLNWLCGGYIENRWLLLSGQCGNGKTTTAKALMTVFAKQGQNSIEKNAFDIDLLYKSVDTKQRAFDEFTTLKTIPLLFVDDLGTEKNSDGIKEILYYRYNQMLVTVFTSNLEYKELSGKYDARIFDRFEEMTEVILFVGESFRKRQTTLF